METMINAKFLTDERWPLNLNLMINMKTDKKSVAAFVAGAITNTKTVTGGAAPKHPGNFTENDHPQHPGNEKQRR